MSLEDEMIRRFRGIPRGYQKDAVPRTKTMDVLLQRISKKYKIDSPRLEVLIIQNWKQIVGANKAQRCKPNKIVNNTLIITTMNTTLRMELQFERTNILKNLHQATGDKSIRDIVVR